MFRVENALAASGLIIFPLPDFGGVSACLCLKLPSVVVGLAFVAFGLTINLVIFVTL
jgi:hypothetical protein